MSSTPIQQAKLTLPLPLLIQPLGLGDHASKNTQCPFHDDSNPSFSVFQIVLRAVWCPLRTYFGCIGGRIY